MLLYWEADPYELTTQLRLSRLPLSAAEVHGTGLQSARKRYLPSRH